MTEEDLFKKMQDQWKRLENVSIKTQNVLKEDLK